MLDHLKPDCMLEFRKKHLIKQSSFRCTPTVQNLKQKFVVTEYPYFITPTVGWSTYFDKILNL